MSQVFRFVVSGQSPAASEGGGGDIVSKLPEPSDATVTYRHKRVRSACNACKRHKIRCSGSAPCSSCRSKQIECVFLPQKNETHNRQVRPRTDISSSDKEIINNSSDDYLETQIRRKSDSVVFSSPSLPPLPSLKRQLSSQSESSRPVQKRDSSSSDRPALRSDRSGSTTLSPYRPSYFGFPVSGLRSDPAPTDRAADETRSTPMRPSFSLPSSLGEHDKQNIPPFSETPKKPVKLTKHGVKLHQPYFRLLGPTSIAPPRNGTFRLLSVSLPSGQRPSKKTKLSSILVDQDSRKEVRQQVYSVPSSAPLSPSPEGDDTPGVRANLQGLNLDVPPRSTIDIFYQTIANYLPYLSKEEMEDRLVKNTVSRPLRFAIGALAGHVQSANDQLTKYYLEQAKQLVIPLLGAPSIEVVYILVLIAYAEFGQDRDSGLWSWSGLALRMSSDLGLQKDLHSVSFIERAHRRRVFWSTFCLDRFISCGTGRITTLSLADIEHDPAEITWADFGLSDAGDAPSIFSYLCKLLILMGKVSNRLNILAQKTVQQSAPNNPESSEESPPEISSHYERQLRSQIAKFYSSLPSQLTFTVDQFQHFVRIGQSQVFLLFHFWSHALILATSHPSLAFARGPISKSGDENPDDDEQHCQRQRLFLEEQSTEMARVSALSISDMISFTEMIQPEAMYCLPFASQPILMAASAVWSLWKRSSIASPACAVLSLQQSFVTCQNALHKMQSKWKGVSWLTAQINSLAMAEPDVDLCRVPKDKSTSRELEDSPSHTATTLGSSSTNAQNPSAETKLSDDGTWGLVLAGTTTSYDTGQHLSPITTSSSISGYSPKSVPNSMMAGESNNGSVPASGLHKSYFDHFTPQGHPTPNVASGTTQMPPSTSSSSSVYPPPPMEEDDENDEGNKLSLSQFFTCGFEDIRDDSVWKNLLAGNATLEQLLQQEMPQSGSPTDGLRNHPSSNNLF